MEWHEWVLWAIALLSFGLSISKWIYDLKKIKKKIKITFNTDSFCKIIVENISDETFFIKGVFVRMQRSRGFLIVYPKKNEDDSHIGPVYKLESKGIKEFDVPIKEFYDESKLKTLIYPLEFRVEIRQSDGKSYYSKKKILNYLSYNPEEPSYSYHYIKNKRKYM